MRRHDPLADLPALRSALLPAPAADTVAAWNQDELADLVAPGTPRIAAAVLVALVPRSDGPHVLLTRRTDSLQRHAGQVAFPGGRVDPDETDAAVAALREAWEEVAIEPAQIQPLGFLDPYETITGFRVQPLVGLLAPDYRAVPNPAEVADAFEVALGPLLQGERIARHAAEFRGRLRHYWEYREGPHRIWGATAAMLVNLGRRLGAPIPD